jgi:hypothetical protein
MSIGCEGNEQTTIKGVIVVWQIYWKGRGRGGDGDFLCCNVMLTLLVWISLYRTEMLTVSCCLWCSNVCSISKQKAFRPVSTNVAGCHCRMIPNTVTLNGGQELTNCVATEWNNVLAYCVVKFVTTVLLLDIVTKWLTDWLTNQPTNLLTYLLTYLLSYLLIYWLTD